MLYISKYVFGKQRLTCVKSIEEYSENANSAII